MEAKPFNYKKTRKGTILISPEEKNPGIYLVLKKLCSGASPSAAAIRALTLEGKIVTIYPWSVGGEPHGWSMVQPVAPK